MTGRHGHRIIGTENRLAVTGKKPVALLAADIQGQMVAVASRRKARTSPANLLATGKSNLVLMGKPNARLAIAIEQGQAILDNLGPPGPIAKVVLSDHAMASACPPPILPCHHSYRDAKCGAEQVICGTPLTEETGDVTRCQVGMCQWTALAEASRLLSTLFGQYKDRLKL